MNAGASLYIGGKADSMKEGIELAAEIIDSGKALETLDKLIEEATARHTKQERKSDEYFRPACRIFKASRGRGQEKNKP